MNIKVTIVKHYLNKKETYTTLELAEVVRRIKQQIYESVCREVRERSPLMEAQLRLDRKDGVDIPWAYMLPRVCFSSVTLNRNRQQVMKTY
ncbi:MAG: hypothetical protein IKP36_07830, partial [Bacteroidaceae bacterium]|nr:hypothetical protein [Bacteroidaceae bacterium]